MRFLKVTFFLTLLLVALFMPPLAAQTVDRIIAVVGEEVITQSDVDRVLATIEAELRTVYAATDELSEQIKLAKENIINQMVEEKLILSEAKKYDIEVDEDKIEERLEKLQGSFPNAAEFERVLLSEHLTLKDLKKRFSDQQIMKKAVDYFVRSKIKVDPIEIEQFYQSNQAEFVHPEKARVKSILIKTNEAENEYEALQRAHSVLMRLKNGESFEELARLYSDAENAQEGADLGFIEKGQLIGEIDEAIFSLQAAESTDVLRTPQGFRIFKVEEKEPPRPLAFSEAQEAIRQILYSKKFTEIFTEWIEKLKLGSYVNIKEGFK